MDEKLLKNCETFVRNAFENADKKLYYHNITHVEEVIDNVNKICSFLNINDKDREILIISAWFHDIYYVVSQKNHEEESAKIAEKFLLSQNFEKEKIEMVKNCILATKIPQSPKNILEEILCDADLYHIGTEHFFERNERYLKEIKKQFHVDISYKSFISNTINFFLYHKFFTPYSEKFLKKMKEKNIDKLKNLLAEIK